VEVAVGVVEVAEGAAEDMLAAPVETEAEPTFPTVENAL